MPKKLMFIARLLTSKEQIEVILKKNYIKIFNFYRRNF